jgi:hypothetical protein
MMRLFRIRNNLLSNSKSTSPRPKKILKPRRPQRKKLKLRRKRKHN